MTPGVPTTGYRKAFKLRQDCNREEPPYGGHAAICCWRRDGGAEIAALPLVARNNNVWFFADALTRK
jgi:hypothetical protein